MVEGPGCTLNGEKIRAKVRKGQTVKEIRGSLTSAKTAHGESPFLSLNGAQYNGTETLGKELFMYFGLKALRVHFGMNGSMRINPTVLREKNGQIPALQIHLTNDTLCFFDSAVEIRWTEDCEQRVRTSACLDVCSPKFSQSRSEEAVRAHGSRMLCDVLLDQSVMPGVGNIIKNEALFDSGLHPAVKVQQLSDKHIHHLVKMTRDFTILFYKCRKSGSALHRHYKVYKRPQCGQCSHVITACRLGEHGRMTYFCERCQRGDPNGLDVSVLPVRNSLIGWAYADQLTSDSVGKRDEEDWTCEVCTLINPCTAAACDACLTPRTMAHTELTSPHAFNSHLVKYPCTAFTKPAQDLKVNWRSAFGTSTLVFSDLTSNKTQKQPLHQSPNSPHGTSSLNPTVCARGSCDHNVCQGTTSPNYASDGWHKLSTAARSGGETPASCSHPAKKMRIDNSAARGATNARVPTAAAGSSVLSPSPSAPCCSAHNRPAALRVVHKEGENKGRVFYTCSLPRETQCGFFEWADTHFPFCHHGKRCLMRTVLKLGPNNGRNFYTCSLIKGKQCDFFQWAQNGPSC